MVLIWLFKHALQMNFVKNNEIPRFIDKMNKVGNHKTCNFVQNRPEHLWPLLI